MNGKELFEYAQLTNSEDLLKTNDECDEHYLTYLCLSAQKNTRPPSIKWQKYLSWANNLAKLPSPPTKPYH